MKAGAASLAAGILGGTGVLLFLVAFGTDYWLLATETCGVFQEVRKEILTFHHEGFFWRCWFFGEGHSESIWTFWYTSQAHPKFCMHGYLFPMPIALGPFPHPSYDTTAETTRMLRRVWGWFGLRRSSLTLTQTQHLHLGCLCQHWDHLLGRKLGGFFRGLFLLLIFFFVIWKEFAADFQKYILLERSEKCMEDVPVHVYYGWSFMFAAAGVPLVLLSGLLFFLVGRDI
ncbi:TM182 protein, partial [Nyctiprogne leucopyga]|nr:TM182 protein [Nyctiprogne leucopyga]